MLQRKGETEACHAGRFNGTPKSDYPCRTHRPPGKAPVPTIEYTTESAEVKSGGSSLSNEASDTAMAENALLVEHGGDWGA